MDSEIPDTIDNANNDNDIVIDKPAETGGRLHRSNWALQKTFGI
jgi:hypothetical protein